MTYEPSRALIEFKKAYPELGDLRPSGAQAMHRLYREFRRRYEETVVADNSNPEVDSIVKRLEKEEAALRFRDEAKARHVSQLESFKFGFSVMGVDGF